MAIHQLLFALTVLWLGLAHPPAEAALAVPASAGRAQLERLDGSVVEIAAGELSPGLLEGAVRLSFGGFPAPAEGLWTVAERAELRLDGGDRLLGPVTGGRGDDLKLELLGGVELTVVIDRIRSLTFAARVAEDDLAGLEPAASGDRLYWLRSGGLDRVDGTVEAFEDDGVRFEGVLGSKLFPWEEVGALFVEPFGQDDGPAQGAHPVVLDLLDGGRLRGNLVELSAQGLALEVPGAGRLQLPVETLAELVPDDGKAVFLSSLAPAAAVEGSPFDDDLGMRWPHRMDRSVTGGALLCNGARYSRGIGVHAPSRLTWQLDGTFRELRGAVGIDDTVLLLPHKGSVIFRVLVDGQPRWESPVVRGGATALELPALELTGAKELVLEVDMATRMHVADRANWLRMLLVR